MKFGKIFMNQNINNFFQIVSNLGYQHLNYGSLSFNVSKVRRFTLGGMLIYGGMSYCNDVQQNKTRGSGEPVSLT